MTESSIPDRPGERLAMGVVNGGVAVWLLTGHELGYHVSDGIRVVAGVLFGVTSVMLIWLGGRGLRRRA